MAFGLQYLARSSLTQAYDDTLNPANGLQSPIPNIWSYNALAGGANDSTAATQAAGYFLGATGYLAVGDLVYIAANDANHLITITTNTGVALTVTQLV